MPRILTSLVLILIILRPTALLGQDTARARLEREAAGQGAQADKLFKAGQHAAALKLFRAERESRKALGDARYEAFACRGIGCCLADLGDPDGAIEAFSEARRLDAGRDDKGFEGFDGLMLAKVCLRVGRLTDCVTALELALPKLDLAIDRDHECDARICLVTARLGLGQAAKAQTDASRAIALAEELDDPRQLADAWLGAGLIDHELGRLSRAIERIQDARDAYRELDRPADLATATRHLAHLSYRLGRLDRAADRFAEALAIHIKLGDLVEAANDRLDLATIHLDRNDSTSLIREATLARDEFKALGDDVSQIEALVVLAQGLSRQKDGLELACATIRDATALAAKAYREAPAEQIRLLILSAELEHRNKHADIAFTQIDAAETLAIKTGDMSLRNLVNVARSKLKGSPPKEPLRANETTAEPAH